MKFYKIVSLGALFSFGLGLGYSGLKHYQHRQKLNQPSSELKVVAQPDFFPQKLRDALERSESALRLRIIPAAHPIEAQAESITSEAADAVVVFHTGANSMRLERRSQTIYDPKFKFPTTIHPDFRKLGSDVDLMDSVPLMWGLISLAKLESTLKDCPSNASSKSSTPGKTFSELFSDIQLNPSDPQIQTGAQVALWVLTLVSLSGAPIDPVRLFIDHGIKDSPLYTMLFADRTWGGSVLREPTLDTESSEQTAQVRPAVGFGPSWLRQFPLDQVSLLNQQQLNALVSCSQPIKAQ